MPPKSSTVLSTITNHFKPHKAEAIQRLRTNILGLVSLLILSYLLPVPSILSASRTLFRSYDYEPWSAEWLRQWSGYTELALMTLLGYNIIEASYAIKYPRTPLEPISSPVKPRTNATPQATPTRSFKVLSPHTTPQPQKPFAFSPSASTSLSSSSIPYPQSPISTPSRVLHYSTLPSSTSTLSSSTSEFLASPSPVVSAYRGKHTSTEVGRALDGSFLTRIAPDDELDD